MKSKIQINIIDDNKDVCDSLRLLLEYNEYKKIRTYTDPHVFLNEFEKEKSTTPCICIIDYLLKSDIDGLHLVKEIFKRNRLAYFIMISGQKEFSVLKEFVNSSFGGRYIEKGTPDEDKFLEYIDELETHVALEFLVYNGLRDLETDIISLKECYRCNVKRLELLKQEI